jgi:hypothetical protein
MRSLLRLLAVSDRAFLAARLHRLPRHPGHPSSQRVLERGDGLLVEMSIGEFARGSRPSPEALRLDDGFGLLPPTTTAPSSDRHG